MPARYIVKADGTVRLETESEAKAERTYQQLLNLVGKSVSEVEMTYPEYKERKEQ